MACYTITWYGLLYHIVPSLIACYRIYYYTILYQAPTSHAIPSIPPLPHSMPGLKEATQEGCFVFYNSTHCIVCYNVYTIATQRHPHCARNDHLLVLHCPGVFFHFPFPFEIRRKKPYAQCAPQCTVHTSTYLYATYHNPHENWCVSKTQNSF